MSSVVWTVASTTSTPLILGAELNRPSDGLPVKSVNLNWTADFFVRLKALSDRAWKADLYIPWARLRALIEYDLAPVVRLERSLGMAPNLKDDQPVLSVEAGLDFEEDCARIRESIQYSMDNWVNAELTPFGEKHGFQSEVAAIREALNRDVLRFTQGTVQAWPESDAANLRAIVRWIGLSLHGQELFKGLGPCRMVSKPLANGNRVELITRPAVREQGLFSMIAHISVETVPFKNALVLKVAGSKRLWMSKLPSRAGLTKQTSGFLIPDDARMALSFEIRRQHKEWVVGDDYWALKLKDPTLPSAVSGLVDGMPVPGRAWVGFPYSTAYGSHRLGRTTPEADEVALFDTVTHKLDSLIGPRITGKSQKLTARTSPGPSSLRLEDFDIEPPATVEADDHVDDDASSAKRETLLDGQRAANASAMRSLHPEGTPRLWVISENPDHGAQLGALVKLLFGDSVDVVYEPLPTGVHGLKRNLAGAELKTAGRIQQRLEKWKSLCDIIKSKGGYNYALICAPDVYAGESEDVVNYPAGIHALCRDAGANVHHVLPPEGDDLTAFVHRGQSAVLDLLFAHNGYLHGVSGFLQRHFAQDCMPGGVYGLQVIRANGAAFSGELPVSLVAITKLTPGDARCWVKFAFTKGSGLDYSEWFPMRDGLKWIASQTRVSLGKGEQANRNVEMIVSRCLTEIHQVDPKAVVLADWATLHGGWSALRDASIKDGKIGLAGRQDIRKVFPEMRLIRIRRGDSSLAVRTEKVRALDGYLDDGTFTPSGETAEDRYYTTEQWLLEVSGEGSQRHYIGVHGYGGVPTKAPRGLSAYRDVRRALKLKRTHPEKGLRLYELRPLGEGSTYTASVPASIEITVLMSGPTDQPEKLASAVMGLRSGYGHFGSWTSLPAPLFFQRKIDDYLFKYNPSLDISDEPAGSPVTEVEGQVEMEFSAQGYGAVTVDAVVVPPVVSAMSRVADQIAVQMGAMKAPVLISSPIPAAVVAPVVGCSLTGSDLIDAARKSKITFALSEDRKLYRTAIINGSLRVPVPSFITEALVAQYTRATNQEIRLIWEGLKATKMLPAGSSDKRPDIAGLTKWICENLDKPQFLTVVHSKLPTNHHFWWLQPYYNVWRDIFLASEELTSGTSKHKRQEIYTGLQCEVVPEMLKRRMHLEVALAVAYLAQMGYEKNRIHTLAALKGDESPEIEQALQYLINSDAAVARVFATKAGPQAPAQPSTIKKETDPADAGTETTQIVESAEPASNAAAPVNQEVEMKTAIESPTDSPDHTKLVSELVSLTSTFMSADQVSDERITRAHQLLDALQVMRTQELAARVSLEKTAQLVADAVAAVASVRSELIESPIPGLSIVSSSPEIEAEAASKMIAIAAEAREMIGRYRSSHIAVKDLSERLAADDSTDGSGMPTLTHNRLKAKESLRSTLEHMGLVVQPPAPVATLVATQATPAPAATPQAPVVLAPPAVANEPHPLAAPIETLRLEPQVPAPEAAPVAVAVALASEIPAAKVEERKAVEQITLAPAATPDVKGVAVAAKIAEDEEEAVAAVESVESESIERTGALPELTAADIAHAFRVHLGHNHNELARLIGRYSEEKLQDVERMLMLASVDGVVSAASGFRNIDVEQAQLEMLLTVDDLGWDDESPAESARVLAVLSGLIAPAIFSPTRTVLSSLVAMTRDRFGTAVALHDLLECINALSSTQIEVTPEKLYEIATGGQSAHEKMLSEMSAQASTWTTNGEIHRNWKHQGLVRVYNEFFKVHCVAGDALLSIGKGLRDKDVIAKARAAIDQMTEAEFDRVARRLGEDRRIPRTLRTSFLEDMRKTAEFFKRWTSIIDGLTTAKTRGHQQHLEKFSQDLRRSLAAANSFLSTLSYEMDVHAAILSNAKKVFGAILNCYRAAAEPESHDLSPTEQLLTVVLPLDANLRPAGFLSPDVVRRELCDRARKNAGGKSRKEILADCYDRHLANGNLLPAHALAHMDDLGLEKKKWSEAMEKVKGNFGHRLDSTRRRVAMAEAMQAIGGHQARSMERVVQGLMSAMDGKQLGHYPAVNDEIPDFPFASRRLGDHVEAELQLTLEREALKFDQDVERAHDKVPEHLHRRLNEVRELGRRGVSERIAAREMLRSLVKGSDFGTELFRNETLHDYVERFIPAVDALKSQDPLADIIAMLESGTQHPLLASIGDQKDEMLDLLKNWVVACADTTKAGEHAAAVGKVLHGLEFRGHTLEQLSLAGSHRTYHLSGRPLSGVRPFVPPEFGSPVGDRLDLLVVEAKRPTHDQISSTIGSTNQIGFAFVRARLKPEQRSALAWDSRRSSSLLIVDDYLVLFLALQTGSRLSRLLQAGLCTVYCEPYRDTSPVSPEMFRGRAQLLQELRNLRGGRIMFGGRRLGKTSVLDCIEKESAAAKRSGEYAVRIDMSKISGKEYLSQAWKRIHDALVNIGAIKSVGNLLMNSPAKVRDAIVEALKPGGPTRSLMLMLDEADDLLDADASNKLMFVNDLQTTMEKVTQEKFRYIIAGLHNVQRMLRLPNSPLGKLTSPIALKPFIEGEDRQAGIELITEPLSSLGFEFQTPDLPFQILAMTHFYPALVQEYCAHLLKALYRIRGKKPAPYVVTMEHVRQVENNPEVIKRLKNKFELNLELDQRYMVIALVLALRQYSTVVTLMSRNEIRSDCETFAPKIFSGAEDHVYECLLEEMVSLNVLEKDDSQFMLAAPNIAYTLGTREEIESLLEDMALRGGDRRYDPLAIHPVSPAGELCPLPYGTLQSILDDHEHPITVLIGNNASGMEALRKITGTQFHREMNFVQVPAAEKAKPETFKNTLVARRKSLQQGKPMTIWIMAPDSWEPENLARYGLIADDLRDGRSRIIMLTDPARAMKVVAIGNRTPGRLRIDHVAGLTAEGLQEYLTHHTHPLRRNPESLNTILSATGGYADWTLRLLDKIRNASDASKSGQFLREMSLLADKPEDLAAKLGVGPEFMRLIEYVGHTKVTPAQLPAVAVELKLQDWAANFVRWMGLVRISGTGHVEASDVLLQ